MYPFSQRLLREEILPHDLIQFVQGELHVEQDGLVLFGPHRVFQYPVQIQQDGIQNLWKTK